MKRFFALLTVAGFVTAAPSSEPILSSSVLMQYAKSDKDASGIVPEGIALTYKVDGKPVGAACFDILLCRWAGVWTPPGDGQPALKLCDPTGNALACGPLLFQTSARPGWLGAGDSLRDPRCDPLATLPKEWAQWSGLHVSGEQVILEYTVQGVSIRELGAFKRKNGIQWFERILEVSPSAKPLTLVVCDAKGDSPAMREDVAEFENGGTSTVALWDSPHGEDLILTWKLVDKAICLEIPPLTQTAHIAVRLWHGPADAQPDRGAWEEAAEAREPLPDLSALARDFKGGAGISQGSAGR